MGKEPKDIWLYLSGLVVRRIVGNCNKYVLGYEWQHEDSNLKRKLTLFPLSKPLISST
jgi:hypothetical protein